MYRSITSSFRKKLLSIAEVSSSAFLRLDPTDGHNLCTKMLPVVAGCLISDSLWGMGPGVALSYSQCPQINRLDSILMLLFEIRSFKGNMETMF